MPLRATVSQAVCRNCWTWYANGETVCPNCRVPLTGADAGAPAFTSGGSSSTGSTPTVASGAPSGAPAMAAPIAPAGFNWMRLLPIGGIVALAVIAFAVIAGLNLGGPATASDGSFSVQPPSGWHPTTWSFIEGRRVVLALEKVHNGVKSDFAVADFGQQVPLARLGDVWGQMQVDVGNGQFKGINHLGALNSTTVGGAPAVVTDVGGPDGQGQLMFINYGNTTYIVAFVSSQNHFDETRDTDWAQIQSTWKWLK